MEHDDSLPLQEGKIYNVRDGPLFFYWGGSHFGKAAHNFFSGIQQFQTIFFSLSIRVNNLFNKKFINSFHVLIKDHSLVF